MKGLLSAAGVVLLAAATAHASPPPSRIEVALARICVSEAGLPAAEADCAGIIAVLRRRAALLDLELMAMARAYSGRTFDRGREDQRRWIAWLDAHGRRPRGWPTGASWTRYGRPGWYATLRLVRELLAAPDACQADHWGMRSGIDLERALEAGWEPVDCGDTRNAFWRVPRRGT